MRKEWESSYCLAGPRYEVKPKNRARIDFTCPYEKGRSSRLMRGVFPGGGGDWRGK